MSKFNPFKLYFVNDLHDVDQMDVSQKVDTNSQLSTSFLLMLVASTIVCSLGLLLDSSPVVIGGMIISPLMWPLMKISFGISYERKSFIQQAIQILLLSIGIVLISAFLITYFSPIKVISQQILTRTNPTLLDLIVAIAAGAIAAFGLVQKKVSDSLAGVAIATSLMPPLCVSGIGLALQNYQVSVSGFLLFFANVISIIFISLIIFRFVGIRRNSDQSIHRKGIFVIGVILVLTSLPLVYLLRSYSFKTKVYQESKSVIESSLADISKLIVVQSIKTNTRKFVGEEIVFIEADITVPEDISLDYQQKNQIINNLEDKIHKKVDLNLRIQKTLSLRSEDDVKRGQEKAMISNAINNELSKYNGSLSISAVDIQFNQDRWDVSVIARTDPKIKFTEAHRNDLQNTLNQLIEQPVTLSISLIPLIQLTSEPDEIRTQIKDDIALYLSQRESNIEITNVLVSQTGGEDELTYQIDVHIETPQSQEISSIALTDLKEFIESKYGINTKLNIIETRVNIISIEDR